MYMFDVFDILLPELSELPPFHIRAPKSDFGPAGDETVYYEGLKLGVKVAACEAYSDIVMWTGAEDRIGWTVLLSSQAANEAAARDATWEQFLAGLTAALTSQPVWRVTCESDCEQHPLEHHQLAPEGLVQLLDTYRTAGSWPIALLAEPRAQAAGEPSVATDSQP